MKKSFAILLTLLVLFIYSISASDSSFYLKGAYLCSYDTNVYSNPMVRNASASWLNWRVENPYIKRMNNGLHLEGDVFFNEDARTGLSISLDLGYPFMATEFIPEGNFSGEWEYASKDVLDAQNPRVFLGIGPTFRYQHNNFDFGANIRLSVGSYDLFDDNYDDNIILGIMAEPYVNMFINDEMFVTAAVHYDAHLMSFYVNNPNKYFVENYTMLTFGGYIGLGFSFDKPEAEEATIEETK